MLPNPLPDNPQRWEGWRKYNSEDPYERLCLTFDDNPTTDQIEEHCRQLLVWWQKKLPLKNQPSNPIAQMLRAGMDEAPQFLAEARTRLLDPVQRGQIDSEQRHRILQEAVAEFKKFLPFFVANGELTEVSEERVYEEGSKLGLLRAEMERVLNAELERLAVVRVQTPAPVAPPPAPAAPAAGAAPMASVPGDPATEFRRVLRLSKLCLDGDDMTDDQRDALCNMGESLGLTGGEAEDLIDEYLEEMENAPMAAAPAKPSHMAARGGHPPAPMPKVAAPKPVPKAPTEPTRHAAPAPAAPTINTSPVARLQERAKYPNYANTFGMEMLLIPSGVFLMGSDAPEVAPHEQPAVQTTVSCFYLARFPVTNVLYEKFDPKHAIRRGPWANDDHPVIYVSQTEALAFCQWLSTREGRRYRLPTEAEWEYAARGTDNRIFPWGERLDAGHFANFADKRSSFPWSDGAIDDGFAETSPVGSYPRGASPFGVEDLSGNVYEWCLDFFDFYKGQSRVNPKGPANGTKRVYRGGSWKARVNSLRASARSFNTADYVSNDVGFRVVCECE